jgi:hypothetical protein
LEAYWDVQDSIEVYRNNEIGGKQDAIIQHFIFIKYTLQYFIQGKRFRMSIFARLKLIINDSTNSKFVFPFSIDMLGSTDVCSTLLS